MNDHKHKQTSLSEKRNELYKIKDKQKQLKRDERVLKSYIIKTMNDNQTLEDENGTIEKISRKPKRIYDKELLAAELKQRGLTETDIKSIIDRSIRKVEVSEYLSVTSKRRKSWATQVEL